MKVLDPQSALLTNAEVYQFLKANPPRTAERQVGAYPTVSLAGYGTVRKDFDRYTEEITPHVKTHADVQTWMTDLIKKLRPYGLTKTEVMNLINLGVGVQKDEQVDQADGNMETEEEAESEEDLALVRDELRFRVVVEESEERFAEELGEEKIREVIDILRQTIKSRGASTTALAKKNGAHHGKG